MIQRELAALGARRHPTRDASAVRHLVPLVCLSFAVGAILDVVGTGAPLALHARGLPLAAVGLFQIVYLPAGLGFLWAPLLDRTAFAGLPRRLGWITPAMLGAAGALALSGAIGLSSLPWLLALAFLASLCAGVADLASQALVIETVPAERRAWTAATRLVAASAGSALGICLATSVPGLGWSAAFVAVAGGSMVLTVPMTAYPEPVRPRPPGRAHTPWRWRLSLPRAAALSLYCVASILLTTAPSFALLDVGLDVASVGMLGGPATTVVSSTAMLVSAAVAKRIALGRQIALATMGVAASASLLIIAVLYKAPNPAIVSTLLVIFFDAGLNVPYMRLLYRWSEGDHAARDYALLAGIVFLVSFPARIAGPALAAMAGWPEYLATSTVLYVIAGTVLVRRQDTSP